MLAHETQDLRGSLAIDEPCRQRPSLSLDSPFPVAQGLDQPGAPKPKLENEKPKGETVSYDELLKSWQKAQ